MRFCGILLRYQISSASLAGLYFVTFILYIFCRCWVILVYKMSTDQGNFYEHADLLPHFECPVCFGYILPPIFQCTNGHLICNTCMEKVSVGLHHWFFLVTLINFAWNSNFQSLASKSLFPFGLERIMVQWHYGYFLFKIC